MGIPATRYATTADGLSIAYQQVGDQGPPIVWMTGAASHIELFWDLPGWAHVLRRVSSYARLVWFDKRGAGLSDRLASVSALEERMEDLTAVMDAVGFERATVMALSESGAIAAMFAATFPERVDKLVLVGSFAHRPELAAAADTFESVWGQGELLEAVWAQGVQDVELLGRIERAMGTPRSMAALTRAMATMDARPVLPLVQAPTLVLHCTGDPVIPIECGRELVDLLPDATLVEVPGDFHGSGRPEDMDLWATAVERFLLGDTGADPVTADRVLATVLFTDIVGSTERAAEAGDARWAQLLDEHDAICARAVAHGRGQVVKTTGDGLLATFDGPATAITAAQRMIDHLAVLGLRLRAGVHTGEVERRGSDIGGIGVNLAARVMGAAGEGQVWVSSTVPGLTVGAPVEFVSQGRHELRGIPGEWELFAARVLDG